MIPPITDPLGKYWEQPDISEIKFEDGKAIMSLRTQKKLGTYDFSLPSGTYVGKMWKCKRMRFFNHYNLCWYDEIIGNEITIKRVPIVIGRMK